MTATSVAPPAYIHGGSGPLTPLRALGVGVPTSDYLKIPIVAFLVEHPQRGPLLIDTGLHATCASDPASNLGRLGARVFSPRMDPEEAVAAQLRTRGIEPGEIGLVVMTHMHIDHASAIVDFPNATFVVSQPEWDAANGSNGWYHGYRREQFDHPFECRKVDFDDAPPYDGFSRSLDLLEDGSVRLVFTPGHTQGHMSVVLRTQAREVVVAGDAIYTKRALDEGVRPYRMENEEAYGRSLRELQEYARANPDALVIPGHDMEFWETLEPVY